MSTDPADLRNTLAFALEKYPELVDLADVQDLLLDSARESGKRPAYLKIAVPDETVKALRGRKDSSDRVLLVRVPAETADRAHSPIILPNEVR
jgi:hypothetical protein